MTDRVPRSNTILLGQGREAEVFLQEDGTVIKLMRATDARPQVLREAAVLTALGHGDPIVPAFRGTTTVRGRPGLVMEHIAGPDLLTSLLARPWLAARLVRVMANTHARIHTMTAPAGLPELRSHLRDRIEAASGDQGSIPRPLAVLALSELDRVPEGDRLCHGDFHLGNIMGTPTAPLVIDWPNACCGDPTSDVARTLLLHSLASPPPGSPRRARAFVRVLGPGASRSYLAEYRRSRAVDQDALRRWTAIHLAVRLTEPVAAERARLISGLERYFGGGR